MVRRWGLGAVAAVLAVGACGSLPAPGGDGSPSVGSSATSGPKRAVTAQPVAADGALACPASIANPDGMAVPQPPQGVDGNARLLPDRDAATLVVCSYPVLDLTSGSLKAPFALKKRSVATAAQRRSIVDLMTWAPRDNGSSKACTAIGGNETVQLVGVTYGDAIVWVAAKADPNSCSKSTNGDFVSSAAVGARLDALLGTSDVPNVPPVESCSFWGLGRLGDDVSLAPAGAPLVTVCRTRADGQYQASRLTADQSSKVVAALRALDVTPSESSCMNSSDDYSRSFQLLLTYPKGPSVRVNVSPTCTPQVFSAGLAARDAKGLVELVEQWSKPIPGPDKNGSVSIGVPSGS